MADILPMFPLSLIVYPGEQVNLHIFEPRYKQLIHECEQFNITFAIPPVSEAKNFDVATEVELIEISRKYPDGKMDVKTRGIGLVKVLNFYPNHPGKLYPGAEIIKLPQDDEFDLLTNRKIVELLTTLYNTMKIDNVEVKDPELFRTFQVAHKVGMSRDQELTMLYLKSEKERANYLLAHLEEFIPRVIEMENLRRIAALNGHFKNINPSF